MKLCEWVGGWCARARARKLEGLLKNAVHRLMLYCQQTSNQNSQSSPGGGGGEEKEKERGFQTLKMILCRL